MIHFFFLRHTQTKAFEMLKTGQSNAVLHIHGIYDSIHGIDNIVADRKQYDAVLNDKGAQFIQNFLGTRTLVFVGCGKTTEDVNIGQFVEFARKYLHMDRPYYFLYNSSDKASVMKSILLEYVFTKYAAKLTQKAA
jgi:hypothetical protein